MDDREGQGPSTPPNAGGDPARARFYFIAGHRVLGAVLIMLGMLAIEGALGWGKGIGKVLAIAGLVEFFIMPLVFARMWRSVSK